MGTKFQVWKPPEKDVQCIGVLYNSFNDPTLAGVDAAGRLINGGLIVSIDPEGKLLLHSDCCVPGIEIDKDGYPIIKKA